MLTVLILLLAGYGPFEILRAGGTECERNDMVGTAGKLVLLNRINSCRGRVCTCSPISESFASEMEKKGKPCPSVEVAMLEAECCEAGREELLLETTEAGRLFPTNRSAFVNSHVKRSS